MFEIRENDLRSLLGIVNKEFLHDGKLSKITELKYHSTDVPKKSFFGIDKIKKTYFVDSFRIIFFNETENCFDQGWGNLDWLERLVFCYNLDYLRKDYIKYKNLFDRYNEFCNKNQ